MSLRGWKPRNRKSDRKRSPSGGSSPRMIARTIPTYSRMSRTGLSSSCPYQPSTIGRCETPRPMTARPPENSSSVANDCAVATGVRE